jgi:hypothetical protein
MAQGLALAAVLAAGLILLSGCATRGRATRLPPAEKGETRAKADSWYVESVAKAGEKPFSCSFVEFDERGDYLDFRQHRDAYSRVRDLSENDRLLVIIYVHGWKNNSQSSDVVKFNDFLRQLSDTAVTHGQYRVHGIYLSWRGNAMKHSLDTESQSFEKVSAAYNEPIVNVKYARNWLQTPFVWVPEQLSYWSRKNLAEDKVSGVALIRTIYSCGYAARRYGKPASPNLVFLLGHSFGALMLEQSFGPASLSELTSNWPWEDMDAIKDAQPNPLPFDLVMYVNSAAPSIYAKQYYEYMVAHREALKNNDVLGADAPIVISVTSTGDWATKIAHRWANAFARFRPSLRRNYDGRNFILRMSSKAPKVTIPQSYYYQRTPGHNPLLVSHWVVREENAVAAPAATEQSQVAKNVATQAAAVGKDVEERTFETSARKKQSAGRVWKVVTDPPDKKWSSYAGYEPLCVGPHAVHSGYWIVRCPPEIIKDHGDVWSQQAMDMYSALFIETVRLRGEPPRNSKRRAAAEKDQPK